MSVIVDNNKKVGFYEVKTPQGNKLVNLFASEGALIVGESTCMTSTGGTVQIPEMFILNEKMLKMALGLDKDKNSKKYNTYDNITEIHLDKQYKDNNQIGKYFMEAGIPTYFYTSDNE